MKYTNAKYIKHARAGDARPVHREHGEVTSNSSVLVNEGDAMQAALTTVDEFAGIQMEADDAGIVATVEAYIGDLSKIRDIIYRANASKITNSHVLESNTWSFVILDEVSRVLLPFNSRGVQYE